MSGVRRLAPITLYVACLGAGLIVLLIACAFAWDGREPLRLLVFTASFGLAEYADIFFHHERGRQSLNPSEAILLPMVVVLPLPQVVVGVVVAMLAVRARHWREGGLRFVFNVAQYGIGAACAAAVWAGLGGDGPIGPIDAAVAVSAVIVFDAISHLLTAGAIALAERVGMLSVLKSVTGTAALFLVGNGLAGLLLAAAYQAAPWTIALFPLILILLSVASRALLRDAQERERAEHLHTAARALAAGIGVESAVARFLAAVVEVMSAVEAIAISMTPKGPVVHASRRGEHRASGDIAGDGATRVLDAVSGGDPVVVVPGDREEENDLVSAFHATSLVAVPLREADDLVGALVAVDRVGADEYGPSDIRLLEALGHELVISLTSFRLFDEVAEQRERFQRIFDGSREGIALVDAEGRVLAWNPALAAMTGVGERDLLGTVWSDAVTLIDESHRYITGAELGRTSPAETLELVRPDRGARWVSVVPGPVAAGEGRGWVVLVRDVTAEHDLEQAKADFIATISHELRTPLTGIKGSLDILKVKGPALSPDRLAQLIETTGWGAERLERLVMNLLIVSNIDAGDMPIKPEEIDVCALVLERIASVLEGHRLVDVALPDGDVFVEADPRWMAQALDHVLDNARKFGGARGRIMVSVSADDGTAEIAVADEGPGIPKDQRERIFERFARLGDVMTRETQGAGIGLHIARRSIEAMGGTISVDDDKGDNTFRMRFPLLVRSPARRAAR